MSISMPQRPRNRETIVTSIHGFFTCTAPVVGYHATLRLTIGSVTRQTSIRVFRFWNWKAAFLSAILRGALYLALTITHGWKQAAFAVLIEAIFRAITIGFYGALLQAIRNLQPAWLSALSVTLVLPVVSQWLDYLIQSFWHTPNLILGTWISLVVSAVSVLFDWYTMRRGALLVGQEATSFRSDLQQLPAIYLGLVAAAAHGVWNLTRYAFIGGHAPQEEV